MSSPATLHAVPVPPATRPSLPALVVLVTAVAAGAAGMASFFGLRNMLTGGLEGFVIPIVAAIAVALGLYGVWHLVLTIGLHARDPLTRLLITVLGVAAAVAAVSASAWFVATAIGGTGALEAHMARGVEQWRRALGEARAGLAAEAVLVGEAERAAAAVQGLARHEQAGGVSGRVGDGPVARSVAAAAVDFEAATRAMREVQDRGGDLYAQGLRILESASRGLGRAEPAVERQAAVAAAFAQLQDIVGQLESLSAVDAARQFGVMMVEPQGLAPAQKAAHAAAAREVRTLAERLRGLADRLRIEREPVASPAWRPIGLGGAVVDYAGVVAGAWAVGVAIDLLPLLLLLLLLLATAAGAVPGSRRAAPDD